MRLATSITANMKAGILSATKRSIPDLLFGFGWTLRLATNARYNYYHSIFQTYRYSDQYQESCETGKPVEYTSETNYHFKLSAFQDRLIQLYQSENQNFVVPEARHNDILQQLISKPLADLSDRKSVV